MDEVCRLLRTTKLSVRIVAEQTVFENVKHLPECFKFIVDCSMGTYRGK